MKIVFLSVMLCEVRLTLFGEKSRGKEDGCSCFLSVFAWAVRIPAFTLDYLINSKVRVIQKHHGSAQTEVL